MDLRQIAHDIPNYDAFLTVDELNASTRALHAAYPELTQLRRVGETRSSDPIEMLTIKGGSKQALVFGGPHPNEPIGTMTIEYLSHRLCEDAALRDELGFTWHFIKCIDADGMRLNEGWFKGPFTPTNYARHFFRPASFDQVEWTFPIHYKTLRFDQPLPETQTLMRLIDEIQPHFIYSLHNAGFGGVYYYVSRDCAPLYPLFHELPSWYNLALELGEPEVPFAKTFAPAIYDMIRTTQFYDYLLQNGTPDPAAVIQSGMSSADYSDKYGSFFLVVELPYFDDPRVNSQKLTNVLRRDAILQGLEIEDESDHWANEIMTQVRPMLTQETLITRAVSAFLKTSGDYRQAQRQWAASAEETNRPATEAEVFSNLLARKFYRLLIYGMLVRVLADELAAGNPAVVIADTHAEASAKLDEMGADLEHQLNYRALPIRSLVGVQVCAGLATAQYLAAQP